MSLQITPLFPVSGTDTAKVQGIPVSTVDPINGQVLVYNEATLQYEPAVATTGATEIILGTNDNLFAEISTFTFLGDPAGWEGQYFTIGVPTGRAYVWFNRDGNAEDPTPAGFVRGIAIDAGDAPYGSPSQNRTLYTNKMVTVFSTDPDLSATKNGDEIILTSRANGERSNIALVTISGSDASVAVVTDGGGMKGSVVLKSGNANADVSIKNIDGNIRFEKSSGNVILGNAAGTVALTSQLPTFGAGVATALALATNATGGVVLAGGTSSLNINGTVGATTPAAGAFTSLLLGKTITASGTTGAQTINKSSGSVNFAAAATSLVVTNSLATVNSVIVVSKGTNDATARLGAAVAAAGSFTIYMDVAPATETRVNFILTN